MKMTSPHRLRLSRLARLGEQAQIRVALLTLISFLAGVAVTAVWFHSNPNPATEKPQQDDENVGEQPPVSARGAQPARPFLQGHPPVDAAAIDEVKQLVPKFTTLSLADGQQILQDAMLKKFQETAKDTDAQVKQAEQQITRLQTSRSPDELQAARKHLEEIKAQGTGKLQQIAARLQTDIAALQQLKGTAQ